MRTPYLAPTDVKEDEGKNWQSADPYIVSAFDLNTIASCACVTDAKASLICRPCYSKGE